MTIHDAPRGTPGPAPIGRAVLVASGDGREAANAACWPAQAEMEARLGAAFAREAVAIERGHPIDPRTGHGFISSQRMGIDVFRSLDPVVPVVVAEAVWQYSHHVLAGLRDHRGPILTVGNWSGRWPGLVGLLNLNGSLTKAGIRYSTLWSERFDDGFFLEGLRRWLLDGRIEHAAEHVRPLAAVVLPPEGRALGHAVADRILDEKAILGTFDEGCMGMYNAIIDDEMLNAIGVYKERLSQSALLAEMERVADADAAAVRSWLDARGVEFAFGDDEAVDLTPAQVHAQAKMYVAALRVAARFDCDAIGIQYQQGLADCAPASDLAEGLLNAVDRPPVRDAGGAVLYADAALPHFNEVDEGAGVDALVTNRVWSRLGFDPSTTLHDVRWGEHVELDGRPEFVWTFMISGGAPATHFEGGYAGASSRRQPPMYFPRGGGTLRGVSKPGELVWSRLYVMHGALHLDIGRASAVRLPAAETERRWQATTPEWPIMHATLHGVTRDQFMGRHKANHVQVAYAPDAAGADLALAAKAAAFARLGAAVHVVGTGLPSS